MDKQTKQLIEKYRKAQSDKEYIDYLRDIADIEELVKEHNRNLTEGNQPSKLIIDFLMENANFYGLSRSQNGFFIPSEVEMNISPRIDYYIPNLEKAEKKEKPQKIKTEQAPLYEICGDAGFEVALERKYSFNGTAITEYVLYNPLSKAIVQFEVDDHGYLVAPTAMNEIRVLQARKGKNANDSIAYELPVWVDNDGQALTKASSTLAARYTALSGKDVSSKLYDELLSYSSVADTFPTPTSAVPLLNISQDQQWINDASFTDSEKQSLKMLLTFQRIDSLEDRAKELFNPVTLNKAAEASSVLKDGGAKQLLKA